MYKMFWFFKSIHLSKKLKQPTLFLFLPILLTLEWVGKLSVKDQVANTLGFVGHSSVSITHLCCCNLKAAIDNTYLAVFQYNIFTKVDSRMQAVGCQPLT